MKAKSLFFFLMMISVTSCAQIDPNKQIDEGKVEKDIYKSHELGWSIQIPDGWEVITKEQTQEMQQKGLDAMQEMVDDHLDASGVRNLICF